MSTPVMGDHTVAFAEEVKQLSVPIIGAQRPAMMKDEGLRISRAPILEKIFTPSKVVTVSMFSLLPNVHDELASACITTKMEIPTPLDRWYGKSGGLPHQTRLRGFQNYATTGFSRGRGPPK